VAKSLEKVVEKFLEKEGKVEWSNIPRFHQHSPIDPDILRKIQTLQQLFDLIQNLSAIVQQRPDLKTQIEPIVEK